jgi:hypothetical protein
MAGVVKLVTPVEQMQDPVALPGWLLRFIGMAEVAGALGLILPGLTGIQMYLTSLAATGLALVTLGATIVAVWGGLGATALFPLAVSLASAESRPSC